MLPGSLQQQGDRPTTPILAPRAALPEGERADAPAAGAYPQTAGPTAERRDADARRITRPRATLTMLKWEIFVSRSKVTLLP